MRRLLAVLAAVALAPVLSLSAPALASSAAPANSTCVITDGLTCQFSNQFGEHILEGGHNTVLYTLSGGPYQQGNYTYTDLHLGWGHIISSYNNECWNAAKVNGSWVVYIDSCASVSDHNELFFIQQSGQHFVIWNYALGTSWYVWGSNQDNIGIGFDSSVSSYTLWDQLSRA